MDDPFDRARRKLARAGQHLSELDDEVINYSKINPLVEAVEPHPEKPDHSVLKLKLSKPLPTLIVDIASDLVHNLRSALDNAAYAVAVASGRTAPQNAYFPFASSLEHLLKHSLGRCKDLPMEIQSLFVGFQPYFGGDDVLWTLNEMCNMDKHRMIIPVGNSVVRYGAALEGTGYFSMPEPHIWDREKNEMELLTLGPSAKYNCQFDFSVCVAFNGIKTVDGEPILYVLETLRTKVERILQTIEGESLRLGYIG
jgi:hypothetical protein